MTPCSGTAPSRRAIVAVLLGALAACKQDAPAPPPAAPHTVRLSSPPTAPGDPCADRARLLAAGGGQPLVGCGPLAKFEIRETVERSTPELIACLPSARTGAPPRIVLRWTVAADGSVAAVSVKEAPAEAGEVVSCVVDRVRRLRFPAPRGGGTVDVTWPFQFTAD